MTCAEFAPFLDAYVDDELDLARALDAERHLASCEVCAGRVQARRQIIADVHREAPRFAAPSSLRAKLATPTRTRSGLAYLAIAASLMLAAVAVALLLRFTPADTLADTIVAAHIRSQMAGHLTDVASTDQHTVKPWLSSRLDFSAPVADLADRGFPLAGGRLEYLDRHSAVGLVYKRREHVINVFIWPVQNRDEPPAASSDPRGYHLVHWTANGLAFWVVSDLAADELGRFADMLSGERVR